VCAEPSYQKKKDKDSEKLTSKKIMKYFLLVAIAWAAISPSNGRFMCDIRWGSGKIG